MAFRTPWQYWAPQHRAKVVGEYLRGCGGEVVPACLPVGTPEPDASEGLWHQSRRIMAGKHLPDFGEFRRAVGGILRTMPHTLDMLVYLRRRARRDPACL